MFVKKSVPSIIVLQQKHERNRLMRTKSSKTLYFDFSGESSIKVAQEYRAKYEAISQILDANRQVLRLAHRDWAKLLSTSAKGRDGYTSEQLLRALFVMFVEGDSYRDVVVRIDNSEFLQYIRRLRPTRICLAIIPRYFPRTKVSAFSRDLSITPPAWAWRFFVITWCYWPVYEVKSKKTLWFLGIGRRYILKQ